MIFSLVQIERLIAATHASRHMSAASAACFACSPSLPDLNTGMLAVDILEFKNVNDISLTSFIPEIQSQLA